MSGVVAAAEAALVLQSLGMMAEVAVDPPALVLPSGQQIRVIEYASPSRTRLQALVTDDTITSPALLLTNYLRRSFRRLLADAGWGWLERTGHLNLPPLGLDHPIEATLGPDPLLPDLWQRPRAPAAALALLRRGTDPAPTTRDLSYYAGISAASAAYALNDLRSLGLIDDAGRPDPAALLRGLAAHWRPAWFGVALAPSRFGLGTELGTVLRFEEHTLGVPGWASVGTDAMAAYRVPPSHDDERPRLYLPDRRSLAWTLRTFQPSHPDQACAFVAVPPTPLATASRTPPPEGCRWPLTDPAVLAIHLATTHHGRAALSQWEAPDHLTAAVGAYDRLSP